MWGRLAAASALVLAAALLGPAAASAGKGRVEASFKLEASHGYTLRFSAQGRAGRRFSADFQLWRLSRKRTMAQSATYWRPKAAKFHRGVLRADFGARGHVAVRFRSGKGHGCRGLVPRPGTFRGRISLAGERGFSVAKARRVHGHFKGPKCGSKADRSRSRAAPDDTGLSACRTNRRRALFYNVFPSGRRVFHWALMVGTARRTGSTSEVAVLDPGRTFEVAPDLLSAIVRPIGLFSGVGRYADERLKGNLRVKLPGKAKRTPLAPLSASLTAEGDGWFSCGDAAAGARTAAAAGRPWPPPIWRHLR